MSELGYRQHQCFPSARARNSPPASSGELHARRLPTTAPTAARAAASLRRRSRLSRSAIPLGDRRTREQFDGAGSTRSSARPLVAHDAAHLDADRRPTSSRRRLRIRGRRRRARGAPRRSRHRCGAELVTDRPSAPAVPPTPAAPARRCATKPLGGARPRPLSLGRRGSSTRRRRPPPRAWISTPAATAQAPLAADAVDRAARGGERAVLAAVAPRRRVGAAEPDVGAPPAGRQGKRARRRAGRGLLHGERAASSATCRRRSPRPPRARAHGHRRRRTRSPAWPPAADAAHRAGEAALAGIVPSAPLNVRPRSCPTAGRPPCRTGREGGGEWPISADAAARDPHTMLQRRQRDRPARGHTHTHTDAGVDMLPRGLPPPLRSAASGAPAARTAAQRTRKLSFTGDVKPAKAHEAKHRRRCETTQERAALSTRRWRVDMRRVCPRRRTESPEVGAARVAGRRGGRGGRCAASGGRVGVE